jgi:hypothetical protein
MRFADFEKSAAFEAKNKSLLEAVSWQALPV